MEWTSHTSNFNVVALKLNEQRQVIALEWYTTMFKFYIAKLARTQFAQFQENMQRAPARSS